MPQENRKIPYEHFINRDELLDGNEGAGKALSLSSLLKF